MQLHDRVFKKEDIKELVIHSLSLLKAPACILDEDENYTELLGIDHNCNPLVSSPDLKKCIKDFAMQHNKFSVYYDSEHIFFLIFALSGKDTQSDNNDMGCRQYLVSGPLTVNYVSATELKDYTLRHNVLSDAIVQHTLRSTKLIASMISFLLYGHNLNAEPYIKVPGNSSNSSKLNESLSAVMHYHIGINEPHNSHEYEINIKKAIARGDDEHILDIIHAPFAGVRGKIALNELRNIKNLAIVDITIISREVIDCGLSSEHIYSVGDAFILRIEKARSAEEVTAIYNEAALTFAREVKNFKHNNSLPSDERIKKAIVYIDKNLTERIRVNDIAAHLNISADYLQDLFKKHLDMSVATYVHYQKIKKAKLLIKNTDMKIEDIALSLGFTNASNFVTFFKRALNVSPLKYRNLSDIRDLD